MAAPGFLESLSPWGSRAATPRLPSGESSAAPSPGLPGGGSNQAALPQQRGGDHRVNSRHRLNPKEYPDDCPPLKVRWFYATDVPKWKPQTFSRGSELEKAEKPKAGAEPKKYSPFSAGDSQSVELAFQKLAEKEEQSTASQRADSSQTSEVEKNVEETGAIGDKIKASMQDDGKSVRDDGVSVPVNEDFLFDVDIDARELRPAYWLGPVYHVRRGSWFYVEGSAIRPCEENLAMQLEEGYVKTRAWRYEPVTVPQRSNSGSRTRSSSWMFADKPPKSGSPDRSQLRDASAEAPKSRAKAGSMLTPDAAVIPKTELQTHRLFGSYMNSIVTYQDANVAWLLTDDFLSRMSSTVYQRFAGGGHLGGIKLVRGYTEPKKGKVAKVDGPTASEGAEEAERGRRKKNLSKSSIVSETSQDPLETEADENEEEPNYARKALERQISQLSGIVSNGDGDEDAAAQAEAVRQKEEEVIREDYRDTTDDQDREIEHLVLVTHGIGQRLGLRLESLNFIHDVNVLRKSLKGVYEKSPDLQALNAEVEKLPKNCRIQVLPVLWRHLLDFPHQSFKENREKDIGEGNSSGDDLGYPMLKDITVEGVAPIRNLVEDLFLDILLYQSDYRDRIVRIIRQECNRIYKLFCTRNPSFHGKVSLIGHSLGSALFFDLLCHQNNKPLGSELKNIRQPVPWPHRSSSFKTQGNQTNSLALDFVVEDFYSLGSPIGLFQMIKGKNIAARHYLQQRSSPSEDALGGHSSGNKETDIASTSSPQCAQIYNIFHPTDPVAYRIEPLISPAMKELKPQPLPYVKKGIFDMPAQGLSGIGMRVGQSVSGLWSSVTTGVASSLLNRSLGLQPAPPKESSGRGFQLLNLTGYTSSNPSTAGTKPRGSSLSNKGSESMNTGSDDLQADVLEHPPTLIDSKLETLYTGFQRDRSNIPTPNDTGTRDLGSESEEWAESEKRARQLRREEAKVRALNANGRVDYSIQEGVFDLSLIGSIASHLSYWADEDVNHFIISQLLARQRVVKREV